MTATRTTSWSHQAFAHKQLCLRDAYVLNWEMGTGKSRVIVDYVTRQRPRHTLVIAPKTVVQVWEDEFIKHAPAELSYRFVRLDTGSSARNTTRLAAAVAASMTAAAPPLVIVANYEGVWRGGLGKAILAMDWDLVVCDEIHRIKSAGGKASWFCSYLRKRSRKRIGLTGTMMPHSPLDIYAQMRFVDPSLFGTSYSIFRSRFAVMGGFQQHQVVSFRNLDEMEAILSQVVHRVTKSEVLDLPSFVHETRRLDLGGGGARIYDQMERDFVADVESGKITANNALTKLLRLQQITSGFAAMDTGELRQVNTAKFDALAGYLSDLPLAEPVVVFARFRRDLDMIRKAATDQGREVRELSGRANELKSWQSDNSGTVLAVQIQSGGVGIDLTRARYCVYYSLGFSLGDYEQSLARLHRSGQTEHVSYVHLVVKNTIDERVYGALRNKAHVVDAVLSRIKSRQTTHAQG